MSLFFKQPFGAVLCLLLAACGSAVSAEATPNAPVLGIDLGGAPAVATPMTGVDHSGHSAKSLPVQMAHEGHAHVQGTGTVNAVDVSNRKVNVTHAPIPKIGWPTMTMDFGVAPSVDLNGVKSGTRIKFDMEQGGDGMYVIQSIMPAGGGR